MTFSHNNAADIFDKERASSYNQRFSKLASMKEALHLCMQLVLADTPSNARILCIGVGTGDELVALAQAFPGWHFTAIEPAPAMMAAFRQRTETLGIEARCEFHEGYIDTLPKSEKFDAATSILVSQFITDTHKRHLFFQHIAEKLHPNGYLINADLALDNADPTFNSLYTVWQRAMMFSGMSTNSLEHYNASLKKDITVLSPKALENIIISSGFEPPTQFCQTLLIHAWYARVTS